MEFAYTIDQTDYYLILGDFSLLLFSNQDWATILLYYVLITKENIGNNGLKLIF